MKTYKTTHHFLTFQLNTQRFGHELWMMLGECESKCQHIEVEPLTVELAQQLHTLALIKGALATVAIEGNTLTEDEYRERSAGTAITPPSQEYLMTEVDNIIEVCQQFTDLIIARKDLPKISVETIKNLNKAVLKNLPLDPRIEPGKIRNHRVSVGTYLAVDCEHCEELLEEMCLWLNTGFPPDMLGENYTFAVAILRAIMAHLYIAWIHPFADGNGRTARLMEVLILLKGRLPSPAVHLLSNHYNKTRNEYYRFLNVAREQEGGIAQFVKYSIEGMRDGLFEQLHSLTEHVHSLVWEKIVSDQLGDKSSEKQRRQLALVLELTNWKKPVPLVGLRTLSVNVLKYYEGKTIRTVDRDVQDLLKMALIIQVEGGYLANVNSILAFMPLTLKGK